MPPGGRVTGQQFAVPGESDPDAVVEAFEALEEGFAVFDRRDRLRACNPRFRELCGLGKGETLLGRSYGEILLDFANADLGLAGRAAAQAWVNRRLVEEQGPGVSEMKLAHGVHVRVLRKKLPSGGTFRLFVDWSDVRRRHRALTVAKRDAEDAKRAMASFIANLSHELRTPLNAIMGFSTMIKDEMVGPLDNNAYKGYATDIHSSGELLLEIVNDVLDISKVEAGKLCLEEEAFDPKQLIEACLRLVETRASEAGLLLSRAFSEGELRLLADQRAIKQILLNLLSNAIKFTPEGGAVEVALGLETSGDLAIQVADSGIGIDAEDVPKALAVFGQIESELSRRNGGAGLGLPLALRFAELHGGDLTIDSHPGRGTLVTLRLPAERVTRKGSAMAKASRATASRANASRATASRATASGKGSEVRKRESLRLDGAEAVSPESRRQTC